MLKITTRTDAGRTIFELEGRLAGAWVDELERCWRGIPRGHIVTVSLDAVSFIDDAGKQLLARFHGSGAELKAAGCMTKCIVQEIVSEQQRS
jgi:hypothetical protein